MKVKQALRDPRAIEGGVWVRPAPDHPEFRVRAVVRGPQFQRKLQALEASWQREFGPGGVPAEIQQRALADLLFEHCIIDIEGLEDCTKEEARVLCGTFEGQPLYLHFLNAVALADARRAIDAEAAAGNSGPPSKSS
jgi:hypothetical protein